MQFTMKVDPETFYKVVSEEAAKGIDPMEPFAMFLKLADMPLMAGPPVIASARPEYTSRPHSVTSMAGISSEPMISPFSAPLSVSVAVK